MADDPVTLSVVTEYNIQPGLKMVTGLMTGGADYDASGGQLMDLSAYFTNVFSVDFSGHTAQADALAIPTYFNADYTAASTGTVSWTWQDGDGAGARVLENVADTTTMAGYQYRFIAWGTEVTRT